MFRAKKFVTVPSKRNTSNGLLTPRNDLLTLSKRQRLESETSASSHHHHQLHSGAFSFADDDHSRLLVETPECAIAIVDSLPNYIGEEIRREWAGVDIHKHAQHIHPCRAAIPSAHHRSGRQWILYYVFILRTKMLLWQDGQGGKVISLSLPDELETEEMLHPFLFSIDGQNLSLMVIGSSGMVLFWEDIELPYESIPLSVQIPLQTQEYVTTHRDATLTTMDNQDHQSPEDDAKSILCWSNQGNVWEVAMEDRRIRVRTFEKRNAGFLSGLTKSVSQFFFSSTVSRAGGLYGGGDFDPNQSIQYVKVVASKGEEIANRAGSTSDMILLFSNGVVERRTFSTGDVMDCTCDSLWHFDATRVAISYFSDSFPEFHLAKVSVVSLPYVLESCFAILVAFVCSSREDSQAKVKYALFQFSLGAMDASPDPEWAGVLDYEPVFSEGGDTDRYFEVGSFPITRNAFYLVWTKSTPVQFASILLPPPGQSSVKSTVFSLQGVQNRSACAFGARLDASPFGTDSFLKGSVSFVLLEGGNKFPTGNVCVATASSMQKLDRSAAAAFSSGEKSWKRLEEVSRFTGESSPFLGEHLDVEEYVRLLLTHFHDDPQSTSPLRVGSNDVATVAQAAVAVDFQILDARPSSGLRWGINEANDDSSIALDPHTDATNTPGHAALVTPKLVRYQLEEKRNRHSEFMNFLQRRCAPVWQFIQDSTELKRFLTEDEEKLNAALSLSTFQGSIVASSSASDSLTTHQIQRQLTGEFLLHAIEKTVEHRGYQKDQLRLAGYNAFDIFYCEVSKIAELFQFLNQELQKLANSIGESDPTYLYALLEGGYSMLSMVKTPVSTETSHFTPTGSWAFTRQVREIMVDQIARLAGLIGNPKAGGPEKPIRWHLDDVFEITDQVRNLGTVLLDGYLRFIPIVKAEDAEDVRKEAEFSKRVTLNSLVYIATTAALESERVIVELDQVGLVERKRAELNTQCVQLCEKYSYFEGMVYLAYTEDEEKLGQLDYVLGKQAKSPAMKRLESYCKVYEGFSEFLFRWYGGEVRNPWSPSSSFESKARSSMMAFLLTNSELFGKSLHKYMKGHEQLSKFCWVSAISIERYNEASALAFQEAVTEHQSVSRRKTMTSIAKIAALAAPSSSRTEQTMDDVDRELKRAKIQEILLQLPLQQVIDSRPLSSTGLVDACLEASFSVAKEDPLRLSLFLMALEALETISAEPESNEYDETRARVWRSCLCDDEELWENLMSEYGTSANEAKMEQQMRQSLLYSAIKEYLSRQRQTSSSRSSAGLTVEMIDELVQRETNGQSIINVRTRQLFAKTLSLARSE